MRFEMLVLGSSSATPMFGRHPTAQLINLHDQLMLVDCGEGTQMQLTKFGIKQNRIKSIFISHLHGDHYLGLAGLLSSMHLMGRNLPLELYGPPGLMEILELQFRYSETSLRYPLHFHATVTDGEYLLHQDEFMSVYSFPLDHRVACTGFRFEESPKPPTLLTNKVAKAGVPKAFYKLLKKGVDFVAPDGTVYPWQTLTQPAPAPRTFAYCSDTAASGGYLKSIAGVDLLYHEATFMHEMQERATETYHTTALQAGQVAKAAGVEKLIIGHYSARYRALDPLLAETRGQFPNTDLAIEGRWYEIGRMV